jgi:hypothetical protein
MAAHVADAAGSELARRLDAERQATPAPASSLPACSQRNCRRRASRPIVVVLGSSWGGVVQSCQHSRRCRRAHGETLLDEPGPCEGLLHLGRLSKLARQGEGRGCTCCSCCSGQDEAPVRPGGLSCSTAAVCRRLVCRPRSGSSAGGAPIAGRGQGRQARMRCATLDAGFATTEFSYPVLIPSSRYPVRNTQFAIPSSDLAAKIPSSRGQIEEGRRGRVGVPSPADPASTRARPAGTLGQSTPFTWQTYDMRPRSPPEIWR